MTSQLRQASRNSCSPAETSGRKKYASSVAPTGASTTWRDTKIPSTKSERSNEKVVANELCWPMQTASASTPPCGTTRFQVSEPARSAAHAEPSTSVRQVPVESANVEPAMRWPTSDGADHAMSATHGFPRVSCSSRKSEQPSPSVSAASGFVPKFISSMFGTESPSGSSSASARNGQVPFADSHASPIPSPSVSSLNGSHSAWNSARFESPSESKSSAASEASSGSSPHRSSHQSGIPSPSASGGVPRQKKRAGILSDAKPTKAHSRRIPALPSLSKYPTRIS